MSFRLIIVFLLTAFLSNAQGEFIKEARYHLPRKDSLFSFETNFSGSGMYNYFSDSTVPFELMMNQLLKKRKPEPGGHFEAKFGAYTTSHALRKAHSYIDA